MIYRVTAPLVIVHDQEGHAHHRYHGERIRYLSDEQRDHLLGMGMVEQVDEPVPGVVPIDRDVPIVTYSEGHDTEQAAAPTEQTAPAAQVPDRPTQVSTKEVWVDYAVRALGVDQAQAEAMTKNDLIALPVPQ